MGILAKREWVDKIKKITKLSRLINWIKNKLKTINHATVKNDPHN